MSFHSLLNRVGKNLDDVKGQSLHHQQKALNMWGQKHLKHQARHLMHNICKFILEVNFRKILCENKSKFVLILIWDTDITHLQTLFHFLFIICMWYVLITAVTTLEIIMLRFISTKILHILCDENVLTASFMLKIISENLNKNAADEQTLVWLLYTQGTRNN